MLDKPNPRIKNLIMPYMHSLYRIALRMTCDKETALEILQDATRQADSEGSILHNSDKIEVDLHKILFEKLNAFFKQDWSTTVSHPDGETFYLFNRLDENPELQESIKEVLVENLKEKDIQLSLENLPHYLRIVVLLNDVEGFSYDEIEAVTGHPKELIGSYLNEGRKQLQMSIWQYIQSNNYFNRSEDYTPTA